MAIIRPSAIVGALSGNLAGVNFATGKSGPYARQRANRTKALSPGTLHNRARFQFLRHQWQQLTDAQRTAWRQAATNRPHINRLGLTSTLSGNSTFLQHNMHGWPDSGFQAIQFDANPPTLTAPPPLILREFNVVSGGLKEMLFSLPGPPTSDRQVFYGARTSSNAPRRTWYNYRFLSRKDILPKPPLFEVTFTSEWDERIGDPQVGERCFAQWFTAGANRWPSVTLDASTVAT